jgi:hypothetical protein
MKIRKFMITNINELKSEILRRGIVQEEDLIGCEERELESIEQQYGTLPLAYKQIMKLLGGHNRHWLCISEYEDFNLERARYLTKWMEEDTFLMSEKTTGIIGELENIFFVSGYHAEFGGGIQFIKTGDNLADSFVYCIDMACASDINWLDTIEVYDKSIWGWIEGYLNIAEKQILKAKPKPIIKVNKSLWQQLFSK